MWDKTLFMTREQIRDYDRISMETYGILGAQLMENAGRGAAQYILARFETKRRIAVVTGPGNNGGDGFAVARHLLNAGCAVTVFSAVPAESLTGDARLNFEILKKTNADIADLSTPESFADFDARLAEYDLAIDALLGTGVSRDVEGLLDRVISCINASRVPIVSLDIPSGLDADTGHLWGNAVRATATVTFGHIKRGLLLYPGAEHTGELETVSIGAPSAVSEQAGYDGRILSKKMLLPLIPQRKPDCHKGTVGHLLVVGGLSGKTGAATITGNAAIRTGCGLVTVATSLQAQPTLEAKCLEVMVDHIIDATDSPLSEKSAARVATLLEGKKAVALGPGLGTGPAISHLAVRLLKSLSVPVVVDADGINILADDPSSVARIEAPMIFTPHPGEMARFINKSVHAVQSDRIGVCRETAQRNHVVVVLKGAHTVVASPDGRVFINPTGNAGMATAGMGDVLTGIIGGLLAQGIEPLDAALLGVYLHGAAGDRAVCRTGEAGLLASDVILDIPQILRDWSLEKNEASKK
jgi:ADP-dependent NAD(P)H-hydrate dehydratase / NAD(P)H-hydrate epimerase